MEKRRKRIIALLLLTCTLISGLGGCQFTQTTINKENTGEDSSMDDNHLLSIDGSFPIKDNQGLYVDWESEDIVTMYLTVREGNADEGTNHTWEEVNTYSAYYYEERGIDRYQVEGLLQIGDENGPLEVNLGYGQYVPNAVVQIRGQSSSMAGQKNYKISLRDGKGDWEGMTTINLNKHTSDPFRFMNMMCYELMQEIESLMSARTRFVHLYVKDETSSGTEDGFVDYGLYTYVEQLNKSYLKNHGLDRNGQFYKINYMEFYRYEDVIMLKSDADYDVTEFEQYLEIKGSDDHSKLIAMLTELNDSSIPIEETFEKWFDADNYFSWLAFNILMGNEDTQSRNHFLYSPSNVNKFYFISWDNDGALRDAYLEIKGRPLDDGFQKGICNYWGNVLHKRVLQNDTYRAMLTEKINKLKADIITEEKITKMADAYALVAKPYIYATPDVTYAPALYEEYDKIVEHIYDYIERNYENYLQTLEEPMPFFLGTPYIEDGKLSFNWDSSFDFDEENVTYQFELSKGYQFLDTIYSEETIIPGVKMDTLEPGQYFVRVTATNEAGYSQCAFDRYEAEDETAYGVMCFWVTEDGKIARDTYVEGE